MFGDDLLVTGVELDGRKPLKLFLLESAVTRHWR